MATESPQEVAETAIGAERAIETERAPLIVARGGLRHWFAEHPLLGHIIRRCGLYLLTLWGAISGTFLFFHLIPGNPIQAYTQNLSQNYAYSSATNQKLIEHYNKVFGLDGNLFQQYLHYLYQLVIAHDLGPSLVAYPTPAWTLISAAMPWTLGLLTVATVLAWILGILLGGAVGWWRNSPVSGFLTYAAAAITHIPYYFIALLAVFFLGYRHQILPSSGAYAAGTPVGLNMRYLISVGEHALLPGASIVFVGIFSWMLGMRAQMIMTLGEDYLTFAEAKGLPSGVIMRTYAMRNSFLPQVTGLAIGLGAVFNGNVLVENLFKYPGLGYLLVQAIQNLDYNVILGVTDLAIFGVLTGAFVLDLIAPALDPRIRRST